MFAVERLEVDWLEPFPEFRANLDWFLKNRRDLVERCVTTVERDGKRVHVLSIVNPEQMRRMLKRVWDPGEFRSEYGLRSLSKYHEVYPFVFAEAAVRYEPAESVESIKGGNSNWRGPVWFPTTFLLIEALRKLGTAYGSGFTVSSPVEGEPPVALREMAESFTDRLIKAYVREGASGRPAFGGARVFQEDPHWRDCLLFYEYFHGETGAGLGASHQTGWTGLVASLIDEWRK